jgi:CTP:molybdopterin cytidylyltransferase MocA
MKVDVVLPAGGRIGDGRAGTEVKALLPIGGVPLLTHTLLALRATGRAGRIAVVGPAEVAPHAASLADAVLPESDSGAANILRGLDWVQAANGSTADRLLVLTTDLPFLTPEAIRGFLDACPTDRDICVPVLERRELCARFPGHHGRFVPLRDGAWAIGCAFLVNPEAVTRNQHLVRRVFAARRSQLGMARLLGPGFILRFLTRQLTLPAIEAKCLAMLGCTGAAVRNCAPELGFDIDYPADYAYAREALEG